MPNHKFDEQIYKISFTSFYFVIIFKIVELVKTKNCSMYGLVGNMQKKRKACCNFLVENNCMNLLGIFPTMPKTLLFKMNICLKNTILMGHITYKSQPFKKF